MTHVRGEMCDQSTQHRPLYLNLTVDRRHEIFGRRTEGVHRDPNGSISGFGYVTVVCVRSVKTVCLKAIPLVDHEDRHRCLPFGFGRRFFPCPEGTDRYVLLCRAC